MRAFIYFLASILGLLGLVFIIGAQGQAARIVIGLILMLGAGGMVALQRLRPHHTTVSQKVDVSGDLSAKALKCNSCGGQLSNRSLAVKVGAVFVNCEFCGATYQLEEEVRW